MTANKCLNGKRHNWKLTATTTGENIIMRFSWCTRCGSITTFLEYLREGGRAKRVLNEKGEPFIEIPMCHRGLKHLP